MSKIKVSIKELRKYLPEMYLQVNIPEYFNIPYTTIHWMLDDYTHTINVVCFMKKDDFKVPAIFVTTKL